MRATRSSLKPELMIFSDMSRDAEQRRRTRNHNDCCAASLGGEAEIFISTKLRFQGESDAAH